MLSPDQPSGGWCEQCLRQTEVSVGGLWVRADNEKMSADRGGQRYDVAHRLHRSNSWCTQSGLPELERLAGTIEACWPQVLGFLQTGVTNAGTEATNRTVKTAVRTAYGFRNLDNQRRRVRLACTRRSRRATAR